MNTSKYGNLVPDGLRGYLRNMIDNSQNIDELISKAKQGQLKQLKYYGPSFVDEEHRKYDTYISIENAVIDCKEIYLRNSRRIFFINCVFNGKVFISSTGEASVEIEFDECSVNGEVAIKYLPKKSSISISGLRAKSLSITDNELESIYIVFSQTYIFEFNRNHVPVFKSSSNEFSKIQVSENEWENVEFSHNQIKDYLHCIKEKNDYNEKLKTFNILAIPQKKFQPSSDPQRDTFDFLLKETDLKKDRKKYSDVYSMKTVYTQSNTYMKRIMKLLGSFVKPIPLVVCALIIILACSILFWLGNNDGVIQIGSANKIISFFDCLYFSAITFLTIGYGDFIPISFAYRIIAIIEGLFGVVLSSAFVVAFISKYRD